MQDQVQYNNMEIDLRIARTVQEVEEMRSPWESMQEHPLTDIDYYLEIVISRPEILRPHVVLLSSNGQPRAMMVGIIQQKPLDLKIGYKTICKPKPRSLTIPDGGLIGEQTDAVADTLVSELINTLKRGETDIVTLEVLRVDSDIYRLAKTKPSFFCRDSVSKSRRHWEMKVPATIDGFFQQIKGSRTLRRKMRQLERNYAGNVAFRSFNEKGQVDQFCRDAEEIAQYSYQRGLNVGFVNDDEHKRRLTQAAKRGWLRAYGLVRDSFTQKEEPIRRMIERLLVSDEQDAKRVKPVKPGKLELAFEPFSMNVGSSNNLGGRELRNQFDFGVLLDDPRIIDAVV